MRLEKKGKRLRGGLTCGLVLLLFIILLLGFHNTFFVKGESPGWQVDVYTQKEPYNGVGLGEASDSFAPHQTVLLYANVTYNMGPVQNVQVSFLVRGPLNSVQNYTLSLSATTNTVGVAETSFTLPWSPQDPETITLGLWTVTAYIDNASDSLSFKVGWIVDLASLHVVDEDPPQGGWLDVHVSLTNLAMTSKEATLALISFDSSRNIINSSVLENIEVGVDGSNLSIRVKIPYWATVGVGTLNASVYLPSGEPYSPTMLSVTFLISLFGDMNGDNKVDMKDVGAAALAFGSYPEHARWNSLADLNKDNKVDMVDIALIARNFGRTYP